MSTSTAPHPLDQTRALLRDLVTAFIEKPDALRVEYQTAEDGAAYWMMQGHLEDEPKLVGAGGSHVASLDRLVQMMGTAQGKAFTFRLITEGTPRPRPARPPRDVMEYDPRPARDLLCRLLTAIGIDNFTVAVGPGPGARRSLTFVFTVRAQVYVDADTLDAIGTLWRAMAKRDGVRFSIVLGS